EWDQVYFSRDAAQQLHQLLGISQRVVDTFQHYVLEGDSLGVGKSWVSPAGSHQLGDRILAVDGHQLVPQVIAGGVQRNGEHGPALGAPAGNLRHNAGCRQRDAPLGDGESFTVRGDLHGRFYILEIVKRLTHAHEHDVGDLALGARQQPSVAGWLGAWPIANPVTRQHDLADDLLDLEIAHQPLRAGMAERAIQRAADLA